MEERRETLAVTALTVWEEKEQAGLLAAETPEWRQMRLVAENPYTTANELAQQVETMRETWGNPKDNYNLLAQAIAAHPNASPDVLLALLNHGSTRHTGFDQYPIRLSTRILCRGLCRNPVVPFLVLEVPDFWHRVEGEACDGMLGDPNLLPLIIEQFVHHLDAFVAKSARLHISLAGEIQTQAEAIRLVQETEPLRGMKQAIQRALDFGPVHELGQASDWKMRFTGAMKMEVTDAPFGADPWGRSPRQQLDHLAHDGNRLVRWVAQTRLRDPHFDFTWGEGE